MKLTSEQQKQLAGRVGYYRELGIYDFYRQPVTPESHVESVKEVKERDKEEEAQRIETSPTNPTNPKEEESIHIVGRDALFDSVLPVVQDKPATLKAIREDIGDCTRCRLSKGRKNIVFGVGNMNADIMFIGEGPGADEDEQGEPFVGRAGQLLNNMISAMGIKRQDVYIANVVKCRPPGNRTPEKDECDTCGPFLLRQIEVIRPKVIVALGAVAAKYLLAINDSMANLRGRWYDLKGSKLAVTYHPAYLLRDPRQKKEAWKDLQMVMKYLGLKPSPKSPE